nr:hypothetical protein [Acidobacteriota bacterium]
MSLKLPKNVILSSTALVVCQLLSINSVPAQQRRAPEGGQRAVVVDERLAALRDAPGFSATLLHRLSRGRTVTVRGARHTPDGVTFY